MGSRNAAFWAARDPRVAVSRSAAEPSRAHDFGALIAILGCGMLGLIFGGAWS